MRPLLSSAVILGLAASFGGCDGKDGSLLQGPEARDKAPDGSDWRRVETVRPFGPSRQLTPAERRLGRRIVANDASLRRLLRDAGGHRFTALGPVTPAGASALVGAFADIKLSRPVTGSYRLPGACIDLRGEFVHVGPTEYRLSRVDALMVSASFAERAVFEASPGIDTAGDYEIADEPKTWPRSCQEAAERGIGD